MTRDAVIEAAGIIKAGNAYKARIAELRDGEIQHITVDVQAKDKTSNRVGVDCSGDDMTEALCGMIQTRIDNGVRRLKELGVTNA